MLSYNAQSIRKMNNTQIPKITATEFPVSASSRDIPPNSYPYPAGRTWAATSRTAWMACPELYPSAACPLTEIAVKRLNREID